MRWAMSMAAIKTDRKETETLSTTPSPTETQNVMRSELQSDYTQSYDDKKADRHVRA